MKWFPLGDKMLSSQQLDMELILMLVLDVVRDLAD